MVFFQKNYKTRISYKNAIINYRVIIKGYQLHCCSFKNGGEGSVPLNIREYVTLVQLMDNISNVSYAITIYGV